MADDKKAVDSTQEKRLTKRDVVSVWFRWLCLAHVSYSYERYQGLGFCQAMGRGLKKLYPNKEDLGRELTKHTSFFNTEPYTGGMITGAVLAMEESRANGAEVPVEAITSLKAGLMGPFAGVGDSLVQGIIAPVLLSLGISLAGNGSLAGAAVYTLLTCVILLAIGYGCYISGYKLGTTAIHKIIQGGMMKKLMKAAGILGCAVLGALVSNYVKISTPIVFHLQNGDYALQTQLFDAILPGMLSLGGTLGVYTLLKKGVSSLKMVIILFAAGIALSLLGIIG